VIDFISNVIRDALPTKKQFEIEVEIPKVLDHGDYSSNIALKLSKELKSNPKDIAKEIIDNINRSPCKTFKDVSIKGPGFINFSLSQKTLVSQVKKILTANSNYGRNDQGNGLKAIVEFVSANPTGPLTVGHGRGAMLGDTVSNLLSWGGYEVDREYYFNNAGKQMRVLGDSVSERCKELLGLSSSLPENGYEGQYIYDIAEKFLKENNNNVDCKNNTFKEYAEKLIFKDIESTLKRLGLTFDKFFNENDLYEDNSIDKTVKDLKKQGLIYEKDGATWFKASECGRIDDRVLIKSSGEPTYRLPDIAYHRTKFERRYDFIIDVFGADHMDAYPDVIAALQALGYNEKKVKVLVHQFVTVTKEGQPVKMSTRKANFVTLDELIDEVGSDVVRYFFIMRGMNTHLNFDIDIAKQQTDENPVFYLQYAHARISNLIKRSQVTISDTSMLSELIEKKSSLIDEEHHLICKAINFPLIIQKSLHNLDPQLISNYLQDIASSFHKYYAKKRIISSNEKETAQNIAICKSIQIVISNGLTILGISAPERM